MVRPRAPRTMRRNLSPGLQMHLAIAASLPNASEDGGALTRGPGGGGQVLVGDAAHAMPPFLGQGANQAIQDAYALARALAEADTVAAALAQYQRARLPPTAQVRRPPPCPPAAATDARVTKGVSD
jgi:2-polyprenyl-6-methoxyphenol hydroxylase-like FAD-dependent oxidoreductase